MAARQELSHALYKHDAACRVIARLVKERDEAQQAVLDGIDRAKGVQNGTSEGALKDKSDSIDVNGAPSKKRNNDHVENNPILKRGKINDTSVGDLPESISKAIEEKAAALSSNRRKRVISKNLASAEEVGKLHESKSFALHKTTDRGILDLDVNREDTVASAGVDGNIVLMKKGEGKVLRKLSGHTDAVTSIKFVLSKNVYVSGSQDNTVRIWSESSDFKCTSVIKEDIAPVVSINIHPTESHFITSFVNSTWGFYDLERATCVMRAMETSGGSFTSTSIHPDGMLLGTGGSDSLTRIWDLRARKEVMSFTDHEGAIDALSFSENGYFLATAASDGVNLLDLRKSKCIKSIAFEVRSMPSSNLFRNLKLLFSKISYNGKLYQLIL